MVDYNKITKDFRYAMDGLMTVCREREDEIASLKSQIDELAKFILNNIDGEPSRSEGAVDCAIRLLKKHYGGDVEV